MHCLLSHRISAALRALLPRPYLQPNALAAPPPVRRPQPSRPTPTAVRPRYNRASWMKHGKQPAPCLAGALSMGADLSLTWMTTRTQPQTLRPTISAMTTTPLGRPVKRRHQKCESRHQQQVPVILPMLRFNCLVRLSHSHPLLVLLRRHLRQCAPAGLSRDPPAQFPAPSRVVVCLRIRKPACKSPLRLLPPLLAPRHPTFYEPLHSPNGRITRSTSFGPTLGSATSLFK